MPNNNPLKQIINGDFCIGCGVCTVNNNSSYKIILDSDGKYKAEYNNNALDVQTTDYYNSICPFADESLDENQIGKELFERNSYHSKKIGYYKELFAGHVAEGTIREDSTSGGMVTWLVKELFVRDEIDYLIHVIPTEGNDNYNTLIHYSISKNQNEAYQKKVKSSYYPVQMSDVLQKVVKMEGRFAIVGIPCFIKSIRLLSSNNIEIKNKIKYFIGIVCGHLKSKYYGEFLAWQKGIEDKKLKNIDFRRKVEGRKASDFGMEFEYIQNDRYVKNQYLNNSFFGISWAYGFFMYSACNFCDDVLGETADITLGDAWLGDYDKDYKGNNIVVIRNEKLLDIIKDGINSGKLNLDKISRDDVETSQAGCFRMRNEGLAVRLEYWKKQNKWAPKKRVRINDYKLSAKNKRKYIKRLSLMQKSYIYFKKAINRNDINIALHEYAKLINEYDIVSRSKFRRLGSFIKNKFRELKLWKK